jgi:hypothetical protein
LSSGFPASNIHVLTYHGAIPGARPEHRAVVIGPSRAAPTSEPAPTPPSPAEPTAVCGPDVTAAMRDAIDLTRRTFGGWTPAQRATHCDSLDSLRTGAVAWDIGPLHNSNWIDVRYQPQCATAAVRPECARSVQVGGECYYHGSPNYVIYGVMCRLCHDHYAAIGDASGVDRFTLATMLRWIDRYKGTGFTGLATPSGNFIPSTQWAIAGYNGWPAAGTPPGDRNACAPTCPTPLHEPPFRVHWHPDWF